TTADRIQQRVRCDLPVETNGPARLFAAVFDNANTVSGGAQRCNRLAVLVAQVLGRTTGAAASDNVIPAVARAQRQLEAFDSPLGQIRASLAEQRLVSVGH